MNVGIRGQGFLEWHGGAAFLTGVIHGLRQGIPDCRLTLLMPTSGFFATGVRCVRTILAAAGKGNGGLPGEPLPELLASVVPLCDEVRCIDLGPRAIAHAVRKYSIDLLMPSIAPLPAGFPKPWVGYIYDLQHRELPDLFSEKDRSLRDQGFQRIVREANAVVVNSRDTAAKVREAYGRQLRSIYAFPFCACPDPEWLIESSPATRPTPGRYFMISNQFWAHKDHETAFRALALLSRQYEDVHIVCTGRSEDFRRPHHFSELMNLNASLGIADRVHVRGVLPKKEQIGWMRKSVATLQPTLCEGGPGGGAAYDAIAIGTRIILSDIEINKEIASEPGVSFFRANNPESLAEAMVRVLETPHQPTPAVQLVENGKRRFSAFAETIGTIVRDVCNEAP